MKAKRLSFRTLAKLSFRGFFDRPVRLVFTVFLSLVSFVLMGTSVTLARYTPEKAMIETYASEVQSFRLTPMEQKPSRAEADALLPLAFGAVTRGRFWMPPRSSPKTGFWIGRSPSSGKRACTFKAR